tara:strand:+ start:1070 stop:1249 length:180 start_codon:yes stop_codon:yes gene_type:complete
MDTTITEVYKDYINGGMSEDKAAKICLGVMTMGIFDAIEEPMRTDMVKDFINKQKRSNK